MFEHVRKYKAMPCFPKIPMTYRLNHIQMKRATFLMLFNNAIHLIGKTKSQFKAIKFVLKQTITKQ
ncbi:MAG: hypothetical protein ACFN4F_01195 [Porphyromonas endodontalis]